MSIGNATESINIYAISISNTTLLTVDVTAILGILIFLTIGQRAAERKEWTFLTASLVIPFTISALMILVDDMRLQMDEEDVNFFNARAFTALGFALIILQFGLVLIKDAWPSRRTRSSSGRA
jgi:hypothetical protein